MERGERRNTEGREVKGESRKQEEPRKGSGKHETRKGEWMRDEEENACNGRVMEQKKKM